MPISVQGWLPSGFEAVLTLIAWGVLVLAYGMYRSAVRPEPGPPRPSGPTG